MKSKKREDRKIVERGADGSRLFARRYGATIAPDDRWMALSSLTALHDWLYRAVAEGTKKGLIDD